MNWLSGFCGRYRQSVNVRKTKLLVLKREIVCGGEGHFRDTSIDTVMNKKLKL